MVCAKSISFGVEIRQVSGAIIQRRRLNLNPLPNPLIKTRNFQREKLHRVCIHVVFEIDPSGVTNTIGMACSRFACRKQGTTKPSMASQCHILPSLSNDVTAHIETIKGSVQIAAKTNQTVNITNQFMCPRKYLAIQPVLVAAGHRTRVQIDRHKWMGI